MTDLVIKYYNYFYCRVSGRMNYRFRPTRSEEAMIASFVTSVGESAGAMYLFKYFCFQFHYWHNLDTMFGKGNVQFNWVIGKKAFERWKSNSEHNWYSYSTDLSNKFGIRMADLVKEVKVELKQRVVVQHEDGDRMLYHNTPKGLIMCSDYTSMWEPLSKVCQSCTNVEECKIIMNSNYPSIYANRLKDVVTNTTG